MPPQLFATLRHDVAPLPSPAPGGLLSDTVGFIGATAPAVDAFKSTLRNHRGHLLAARHRCVLAGARRARWRKSTVCWARSAPPGAAAAGVQQGRPLERAAAAERDALVGSAAVFLSAATATASSSCARRSPSVCRPRAGRHGSRQRPESRRPRQRRDRRPRVAFRNVHALSLRHSPCAERPQWGRGSGSGRREGERDEGRRGKPPRARCAGPRRVVAAT